jgi:hypothetical protein
VKVQDPDPIPSPSPAPSIAVAPAVVDAGRAPEQVVSPPVIKKKPRTVPGLLPADGL